MGLAATCLLFSRSLERNKYRLPSRSPSYSEATSISGRMPTICGVRPKEGSVLKSYSPRICDVPYTSSEDPYQRTPQIVGIRPDIEVASEYDGDREGNLYLFPLEAPTKSKHVAANPIDNCDLKANLSVSLNASIGDAEISRAAQVLQCQKQ